MKTTDIKGLTVTELKEKIGTEKEALRKLQFAHQISSVENPMKLKETRKLIARLSTELTVKERAAK
ncbi:50S ribosomal protein L29 [Ohtaekwangia koreensis]|jgi:large subunit ribosomal protein L29|uniref:Large ribosomal subunit protein uL29 n=1 Tax=Ohtaekwangia koreensis TaxID=688867 RepID=A0A1T5MJH3_9BACT|nr:50S ribosomal protein L29 [Ohtaekwangia koreensis]SKC88365.1 large subunit ribosomal protein L29 [Ohtaekwangia koreensis]